MKRIDVKTRLLQNTKVRESGCWEWQRKTGDQGYGLMILSFGKNRVCRWMATHRLSWEVHYGEIPDGLFVLHQCDNRLCINPDHLFLGTHEDNMRDKVAKGRARNRSDESIQKLLDRTRQIHELYKAGECHQTIAASLGASVQTVKRTLSGWAPMQYGAPHPTDSAEEQP